MANFKGFIYEIDGFLNKLFKIDGFLGTQEPMLTRSLSCHLSGLIKRSSHLAWTFEWSLNGLWTLLSGLHTYSGTC